MREGHKKQHGWRKIYAGTPKTGCGGIWEYEATGWLVCHCGHPTANRPYYIESPWGHIFWRKFRLLSDAQQAACSLRLQAVIDGCEIKIVVGRVVDGVVVPLERKRKESND